MIHTGLYISILILLAMLVSCHLKNYFQITTSSTNKFVNLAIPNKTLPLKYNAITYSKQNSDNQIPCEIASQSNFPCSQIQTPCTTFDADNLSDSELAIIYKTAYEQAGLELLKRTLNKK